MLNSTDPLVIRSFERCVLQLLLACALVLLMLGALLPLMTVEKFWLIQNQFSLLSGLWQMVLDGRNLLALLIGGFSLLLPLLKLWVLMRLLQSSSQKAASRMAVSRLLHWMHLYGKWSMLDVFVVAVLLASVKLGALAQVLIHSGLYAFAASVLLTMLITARVVYLAQQRADTCHQSQG